MAHLPTICEGCGRVSLIAFKGAEATSECPHCGGSRRVVPSCSYAESDLELFDELSEAVADSMSPLDAQRMGVEVSRALWSGSLSELFDALSVRWPSLVPLVLVTGRNQLVQRRVLLMLKTIFEAMSLTRRSGTIAAVRAPSVDAAAPAKPSASGR